MDVAPDAFGSNLQRILFVTVKRGIEKRSSNTHVILHRFSTYRIPDF